MHYESRRGGHAHAVTTATPSLAHPCLVSHPSSLHSRPLEVVLQSQSMELLKNLPSYNRENFSKFSQGSWKVTIV